MHFISLLSSSSNQILFINPFIDSNLVYYDNENYSETLNKLQINDEIEILIKLNYIWCKDNKLGISANIVKIIKFRSLCIENIKISQNQEVQKSLVDKSEKEQIKTSFVPSINDLLQAKTKLKKYIYLVWYVKF